MDTTRRRYPIGMQTFSELREDGYLYVDKTEFVWRLAHENGKAFSLTRPRRFGKSLLISTMQAYFEGRREPFRGLAIERLETEWVESPVIRLDLSTVKTRNVGELNARLDDIMSSLEGELCEGRRLAETLGGRLQALITLLRRKTARQVVVLVDEYDAPLLNVVDDPVFLDRFREVMRGFYIPLKACDADGPALSVWLPHHQGVRRGDARLHARHPQSRGEPGPFGEPRGPRRAGCAGHAQRLSHIARPGAARGRRGAGARAD